LITVPSTQDLKEQIQNQLSTALGGAVFLPKSFLRVLSTVLAGFLVLLFKYGSWLLLQILVPYASTKEVTVQGRNIVPLVEWGRLFGLGDPLAASSAEVEVTVTVTQQTGSIPAASQLIHAPSGVVYLSTSSVVLNAPTVTVRVRAASDQNGGLGVGVIGNRQPGDILTFASPLPNVGRDTTVTTQVVTAADAESWDAYRTRILEFAQARPQGGAHADYRLWAREVPGIIGAWPYAGDPGQVDVYVEATEESSEDPDGIPTAPQLEAVEQAILYDPVTGEPSRKPVTAGVNVLPITRQAVDVDITQLTVESEPEVQAQIQTALDDHLRSLEPYIVGLSILPRRDRVLVADLAGIVSGVVRAAGGTFGVLTMEVSGDTITAYTLEPGEKAKLGALTYDGA